MNHFRTCLTSRSLHLQCRRNGSKPSSYRPISVTPMMADLDSHDGITVVRHFLYPAFQTPPPNLTFKDQFAFRPTGSTTAAIIQFLHTITSMLANNRYVIVIALDFSKAFNTVRQSTMLHKMDQLDIPDNVYEWTGLWTISGFQRTHAQYNVRRRRVYA